MITTAGTGGGLSSWRTRDMVVTAALAVVFGLLYQVWGLLWGVLSPILGSVGSDALNGFWFIAAILTPYIVRRPGAALVGQFVAALVEMVAGGLWGADLIISGLAIGAGAEVVFALTGWKSYSLPTLLAAGAVALLPEFVHIYLVYGYAELAWPVVAAKFVVSLVSVLVLGVLLGKAIGDALARTGVLSGFALGKDRRQEI